MDVFHKTTYDGPQTIPMVVVVVAVARWLHVPTVFPATGKYVVYIP